MWTILWCARLSLSALFLSAMPAGILVAKGAPTLTRNLITDKINSIATSIAYKRSCDLAAFVEPGVSEANLGRKIEYSYCLILDRGADWAGARGHAKAVREGHPLIDILARMLNSQEFAQKHSLPEIDDRQFVTLLYNLLVGRDPDEVGLASYLTHLETKALSRSDVGAAMLGSSEFRAKHQLLFVESTDLSGAPPLKRRCELSAFNSADDSFANVVGYAYCLMLGRTADEVGAREHIRSLERGLTPTEVLAAMLKSHEFANTHAISSLEDEQYIALLYRLLVEREPDGAGRATFLRQLESGTLDRADIGRVMMSSDEFRAKHPIIFSQINTPAVTARKLTRRCDLGGFDKEDARPANLVSYGYCVILGHLPDEAQARKLSNAVGKGWTSADMLLALLNSDEFANAYATSDLNDRLYIALLYRLLVGREPDGGGLSSFLAQLEGKTLTRADLGRIMIGSSEFRMKHPLLFPPEQPGRLQQLLKWVRSLKW